MLSSLLTKNKKFTQDDLIQELINPNSSSEKLNQIYNFLKIDLNSLQIDEEPILHVCCKKDIFESVEYSGYTYADSTESYTIHVVCCLTEGAGR